MKDSVPAASADARLCPICAKESPGSPAFVKNGCRIYRCASCTALFVHPIPSEEELRAIYSSEYFNRGNKYLPQDGTGDPNKDNDRAKLSLVQKRRGHGSILDVGCAMGGFLAAAQDAGYKAAGVEFSDHAAVVARDRHGLDVRTGTLAAAGFSSGSFDVVTMWDVIEHLADPHETLRECCRVLKPGGLLFLSTGDAGSRMARLLGRRWHLLTPPQHLSYFTPGSMDVVLRRNDFELLQTLYLPKRASLDFVLFKAQEQFGWVVSPFRAVARATGAQRIILKLNLFDIMTCVARRRGES